MAGSMGHVVAGFTTLISIAFLTASLADGQSLMRLQESKRSGSSTGDYAGYGLWKDYTGHAWESAKNSVYACDDRKEVAQTMAGFSLMALLFMVASLVSNLVGLQGGGGVFGTVSMAMNALVFLFSLMATSMAVAIFDKSYCGAQMKDDYALHYAVPCFVIILLVSILNILVLAATGASKNAAAKENKA